MHAMHKYELQSRLASALKTTYSNIANKMDRFDQNISLPVQSKQ